ncbi:MAG: S24 family peptidase [Bryobacteraceae bacterium]|nr:S24 family peptidase [Bryobacteraceae bacterium]
MGAAESTALAQLRVFEALGENCGIALVHPESGEAVFRFRQDWEEFAGEEAEVLRAIAEDLPEKLDEMGAEGFLEWVDSTFSNTFRVLEPRTALVGQIDRTAHFLYRKFVQAAVRPFRTHLPLFELRATGGSFQTDLAVTPDARWLEVHVPGRRSLTEDYFCAYIEGRSMEPEIPDGSLCLFRFYKAGSRQGGVYLMQRLATSEGGGEFTIKRYESRKRERADGTWEHESITMDALNPDFIDWDLDRDEARYVTVAQFVTVLEDPEA